MVLKYGIVENNLTENPGEFTAIAYPVASLDMDAIIARMLARGSTITKQDILAVMSAFEDTVIEAHEDGFTVTLRLFNTSFSISGVYEGVNDVFDGNRHKVNLNLTKGVSLRNVEKRVKLEKTNVILPQPQIQEVKDIVSKTTNERLTSKGAVEVRGYNLKLEGDDPACGLWFVGANGQEIKAVDFIDNKPSRITALIPVLTPGLWQLKLATQYIGGGDRLLKKPKVFVYQKNLLVV